MSMVVSGGRYASGLPPSGAAQSPKNRIEQVLVHYLLDNLVQRLTDRGGTLHPFPWIPSQQVRVGVLGPTYSQPSRSNTATPLGSSGVSGPAAALVRLQGSTSPPIENRGVIGIDFVVAGDVAEVELAVDVEYAIYHPLNPSFAEVAAEAQVRASAAAGNSRRRPTVPINPTWARDQRHVEFSLRVPVGPDEVERSSQDIPGGDPLEADATAAVTTHYATADAMWKLRTNQTISVAGALGTEADFRQALSSRRDPDWQHSHPLPRLTVTTTPTVSGDIAVSASMTNARVLDDTPLQDLAVYDSHLTITVKEPGLLKFHRLNFAEDDVRYAEAGTVVGRGRGCVALGGINPNTIVAETLPLHIQRHSESSNHGVDITFSNLASDYRSALDAVGGAMRTFLRAWDFGAVSTPHENAQLRKLRDEFEVEVERFELGRDLLANSAHLSEAFTLANRTFAGAKGSKAGWRLFQLVFIVTELGALAARENYIDPLLRKELDAVDVLWFPTGGGKTEAYLGLITVGLFFDRLRAKYRGTTAWLLFPLRMLSVQQLARISDVVHHAEVIRKEKDLPGDPFALGYLVGASNTPNRLGFSDAHGWWPGIDAFSQLSVDERDKRRLVGACPDCNSRDRVGLDTDLPSQRVLHVCRDCGHVLPIYFSDEEVTRFQPAIVVSTVDKITSFSRNGQLTSFNHGPRKRCPLHGWYTHKGCLAKGCTTSAATHTDPTGFRDPTPALWIQDELHLVREELGVFAGHYHTLISELAVGAGNPPPKVIAATATIEQYEDQLSQVYGRTPRMFPVGGPTLSRSFYTEVTDDVRRLYLGVFPAGGGTVKVDLAGIIVGRLVEEVHKLTDDPTRFVAVLGAEGIAATAHDALDYLFNYELALAYVNSKAHGVAIHDDIHRLSEELFNAGADPVKSEYLMGETTLGELAATVAAIQGDTRATPRSQRIRAFVGTSVVSHGVDLERLNLEVLAGMPPSYAHYIQATARAGRSHVGLVVSVFDRASRRETSMYQSFATTHAALERMVEPVPVNRFASRAVERTLPGIVCSLLWDETRNPAWPSTKEISQTREFRLWWNANAASLIPHLASRIERAFRCPIPDPSMAAAEQKLVDDALSRWENVERQRMQQWQAEWLTDLFTMPAMTSLRDVDPPVEFTSGNISGLILTRLHT